MSSATPIIIVDYFCKRLEGRFVPFVFGTPPLQPDDVKNNSGDDVNDMFNSEAYVVQRIGDSDVSRQRCPLIGTFRCRK